ncbi:MAG: hypothetical protein AAB522_00260 [Patescibacteria group bacterium]
MKNHNPKLKILNFILLLLILIFAFLTFNIAFAENSAQYSLIEPLPGIQQVRNFPDFVSRLIPFILAFAALAAFVQIVFGGILRATSGGNPTAIGDANDRIWKAIGGLVLALLVYLILNTINPELVSLKFFPESVKVEPSKSTTENPVGKKFDSQKECESKCPSGPNQGCLKKDGIFTCVQTVVSQ